MENARGTEDPAAVPVSSKSPTTGPKGGPTFGIKLSPHTHPHRISGTKLSPHTHPHRISGIKLSLLTRNGSIWRFFCMHGEFCTVLTTKKPSRESYAPFSPPRSQAGQTVYRTQGRDQASQHNNTPGPTGVKRAEGAGAPRRGAGGRQQEHSQTNFAHNFPRSLFETTRKRCNPNEANSRFEQVARELRAKLLNIPGTTTMKSAAGAGGSGCGAHGRRQGLAGLRGDAPSHTSATRPHWCEGRRRDRRARAGFEARRRAKRGCLASRAAGPSGARNTRGHTKPPGPTGAGRLSQYQRLIAGPQQCRGLRGHSPGERWKYRAWRQRPSRFPPCGDPRRRRWRSAWPSRRRSRRRCLRSRPG